LNRGPRRRDMEPALGVEQVGKPEQIALVRPPPVVENDQAGRLSPSGSLLELKLSHAETGLGSAVQLGPCRPTLQSF
jgi:hypothetical protein